MSLLLLSLLLLALIGMGMLMNRRAIHEMFDNPPPADATTAIVSPALANLLAGVPKDLTGPTPQADTLARDQEAVAAANSVSTTPTCPTCPACPSCPTCPKCEKCEDMSKYIRMDEIPCWNCTLP
jgi:hypothetical protein